LAFDTAHDVSFSDECDLRISGKKEKSAEMAALFVGLGLPDRHSQYYNLAVPADKNYFPQSCGERVTKSVRLPRTTMEGH
jgi:hypothetical protein